MKTNICRLAPIVGGVLPQNQASPPYSYPTQYEGYLNDPDGGGGLGTVVVDTSTSIDGQVNEPCLSVTLQIDPNAATDVSNTGYFDWSPLFPGSVAEWGFVSQYVENPAAWPIGNINRMSFWFKPPANGRPLETDGNNNTDIGTYIKPPTLPDGSVNVGPDQGSHPYHSVNLAPGAWSKVILNRHPNHMVGAPGNADPGDQPFPDYYGSLGRFWITQPYMNIPGAIYKATQPQFYQETASEPDNDIYSIAASIVNGQILLTWCMNKASTNVAFDIYISYSDIHISGLSGAKLVTSLIAQGNGGYNNNQCLIPVDLTGVSGTTAFIGIALHDTGAFSQMDFPLPVPVAPMVNIPADIKTLNQLASTCVTTVNNVMLSYRTIVNLTKSKTQVTKSQLLAANNVLNGAIAAMQTACVAQVTQNNKVLSEIK